MVTMISWKNQPKDIHKPRKPKKKFHGWIQSIKKPFSWKRGFFLFSLLIVLLVACAFLSFAPQLAITNIEVQNARINSADEIVSFLQNDVMQKKRSGLFSQNNFFWFSKTRAIEFLREQFLLEDVQIKKIPFHTLVVELFEPAAKITWITNGEHYSLDAQGRALEHIFIPRVTINASDDGEPETLVDDSRLDKTLAQVIDESMSSVQKGERVLTPAMVSFVLGIQSKIQRKTGLEIIQYRLTKRHYTEIKAMTNREFFIYFESTYDLDRQLENLSLVLREKIAKSTTSIDYIDLRDENNTVFIKPKLPPEPVGD